MSEATPEREWRFYLDDMIRFCEKVDIFTCGLDQLGFPIHSLEDDHRDPEPTHSRLFGHRQRHPVEYC